MAGKKLWRVNCELTLYVLAEDEDDAIDVAEAHLGEEAANGPRNARRVRPDDRVESDWVDSLPYGGEDDRTVKQILAGASGRGGEGGATPPGGERP